MANFYNKTVKEVLSEFHTNPESGLTSRDVQKRQSKYGLNKLQLQSTSLWRKLLEPFLDIFMIILGIALVLSALQQQWLEVILIAVIIIIDAIIYYIQQFSTERILRSLKSQTSHTVTVIRNSTEEEIDAINLVPGDIVILNEGDRIPADGRILVESGLLTNESMLTGESDPVAKDAKAISGPKKVYEQKNIVFSGSFVITGSGKMIVTSIGNDTEYGRIASLASSTEFTSPIQEKINKLIIQIATTVVVIAAMILIIQILNQIPLLDALKFTLALIVSAVPEGLPIAISVVLALGARRMAAKKALIKELRAIESIGVITTIASDKTGTLTKNKLTIQDIWGITNTSQFLPFVAKSALVASDSPDPLDTAIWDYIKHKSSHLADINPAHSYAFDQQLKMSGNLYESKTGKLQLIVKGAPEAILSHCRLNQKTLTSIETNITKMSNNGYKVIAVATAKLEHEINELHRLDKKQKFDFVCLLAAADSLREEAVPAIAEAKKSGIRVKMITGDHARTAFAIGKQLGLTNNIEQVYDCSKMGNISDNDLVELVKTATVFARVTPEDKFRLLTAIKQNEIVAMTGDGVNDVPALTNAHVGIAMGDGPSIVQDAGDIVLLDNNFKNIIEAVKEGRVVIANVRRMLVYLLATNTGEIITMVAALLFGWQQLLLPIQILWVNLVTDSLMVIPIGLEPPEKYFINKNPEPKNAPILSSLLITRMIIIAITMSAVTLCTYFIATKYLSHEQANTLAFTALVVTQWANAITVRGTHEFAISRLKVKHTGFWVSFIAAILLQILAIVGPLAPLIHTVSVPTTALALTTIISFVIPLLIVEFHKLISYKK